VARRFSSHRLRKLREAAGLSRQDLADATRRSWFSVYGWERGTAAPSIEALARIPSALDCKHDDLFEETES
jgi:transcriptional regulator with XRE-family HTH domain